MKPHEDRQERKQYDADKHSEKVNKQNRDDALNALLEHKNGRDYIWWLMEISGIGANPFASNALVTSFSCGELNIGQQILAHMLEVNPEGYLKLLKERNDERYMDEVSTTVGG